MGKKQVIGECQVRQISYSLIVVLSSEWAKHLCSFGHESKAKCSGGKGDRKYLGITAAGD